jgi:hypothetical protein
MQKEVVGSAKGPTGKVELRRDVTVWGSYMWRYAGIEVYVVKRGWE